MASPHQTARFGAIHCSDGDIIRMERGIIPFTHARRFVLVAREDEEPFQWLQSLDDPALALVLAPLDVLFPDHAARVWAGISHESAPVSYHDASLWGVVVLDADPAKITVNLLAPILIDADAMTAEQVVLDGPLELAREPLEPALCAPALA